MKYQCKSMDVTDSYISMAHSKGEILFCAVLSSKLLISILLLFSHVIPLTVCFYVFFCCCSFVIRVIRQLCTAICSPQVLPCAFYSETFTQLVDNNTTSYGISSFNVMI